MSTMTNGKMVRTLACLALMGLTLAGGSAYAQTGLGTAATTGTGTATAGVAFDRLNDEEKRNRAAEKVATLLKLLSSAGKNPTTLYQPTKYAGTSTGYDVTIPGTDLTAATLYTRPAENTEVWHVALNFNAASLDAGTSPLTQTYQKLSQFLGTPRHRMLTFVVSEGDATVKAIDFPASMQTGMGNFADIKGLIYLKKGVNLFTRIDAPNNPAFKTIQSALLMGGSPQEGTVDISGSVGSDILTTLLGKSTVKPDPAALAAEDTAKKNLGLPPVSFYLGLPGVIPVPFNQMDAAQAKRSFYMSIDSTGLGFEYDQANKQVSLNSSQDVTLWIANNELKTKRYISIAQDKSVANASAYEFKATGAVNTAIALGGGFALKKVSLEGTMKVDIQKSTWEPGAVDTEKARSSGIVLGSHRGTTPTTTTATPTTKAGSPNQKSSALSLALGVTVEAGAAGDLSGVLGLTTEVQAGGKPRVKEVFFQFNGDPKTQDGHPGGFKLSSIPALANVPGINEVSIHGLGLGIAPALKGTATDFYLYSDMEWVKPAIRGQMGVIFEGTDVTFLSRITNFELPRVIKAIDPNADEQGLRNTFGNFKLPDAILIVNTAKPKGSDANGTPMAVNSLPTMIQPMFEGIVASVADEVTIYKGAISVVGKANFADDPTLRRSMSDLGIKTTGDLLIAGSIGFASGGAQVAINVKLPNFKFPTQNAEMAKMFAVPKATGSFFVRVNTKGPSVAVGVNTDLRLSVPPVAGTIRRNSEVDLSADIYANITATGVGIRVAGYTTSPWERPFGFDGITLNNAALLVGVDVEGSVEFGIGTSLTFDLSGPNKKKMTLVSLEPENKTGLRKDLTELERQLNDKSGGIKKVDVASAFIINIHATGVPKKLGILYNSSVVSIPTTLDIFDLVLKGLVQGPAYDELLRTTKEPGRAVLVDIRRGFNDKNWMPPSQKIKRDFPVPLDAIYLENVEFFFATPGAVLPGFPGLDGNVGLKIKGDLWVTDLATRKKQRVGQANIDLTLNGLDFGAIAKDIEKAYNTVASVTIDALVSERNCPPGAFHDYLYASCWSCPTGYVRTGASVINNDACIQVKFLQSGATDRGVANQLWNCPAGSKYDPRNQGECWSCPKGMDRNLVEAVTQPKACMAINLSKITNVTRANKYGKGTGWIGTDCPGGQFWHMGDGYCYSCPAGTVRSATAIDSHDACWGVGNQQVVTYDKATLVRGGRPAGSFLDIGLGKFYSCPAGYNRTILHAVTSGQACEKVEINYARAKSEPRGQLRNKVSNLCFGAKGNNLIKGAAVEVQDCLDYDSRFQSWFVDSLSRLRPLQQLSLEKDKAAAMCLDVDYAKTINGTPVKIWECSLDNKAQEWFIGADGIIRSKLDGAKCLVADGNGKVGNKMVISDCAKDDAQAKLAQSWHFGSALTKPAAEPGGVIGPAEVKLANNIDYCLEAGSPVAMKPCTKGANQQWMFDSKGQIASNTTKTCLDASVASRLNNGVGVGLVSCAGAPESQRWLQSTTSTFVNGLKRCLTVREGGEVETRDCLQANAASQQWTYVRTALDEASLKKLDEQRKAYAGTTAPIEFDPMNPEKGLAALEAAYKAALEKVNPNNPMTYGAMTAALEAYNAALAAAQKAAPARAAAAAKKAVPAAAAASKTWTLLPGTAVEVAASANGLWVIGTNPVAGGYGLHRWDGKTFIPASGGGVRIDLDPQGNPWLINDKDDIFRWTGSAWTLLPGKAKDIGIGANGAAWVIGANKVPGGFGIWRWNAGTNNWDAMSGGGVRIDVDPQGNAWLVNDANQIFRWTGSNWAGVPGKARDIGVGPEGSVFVVGDNGTVHKWNGSTWIMRDGILNEISVGPGGVPVGVNASKQIWMGYP